MKPSEVLDKAADIIIRDGWMQGDFYLTTNGSGRYWDEQEAKSAPCCQFGAINRAVWGYAWAPSRVAEQWGGPNMWVAAKAEGYINRYVQENLGLLGIGAVHWNDEDGRTAEEVVAALRAAAELARQEGE